MAYTNLENIPLGKDFLLTIKRYPSTKKIKEITNKNASKTDSSECVLV